MMKIGGGKFSDQIEHVLVYYVTTLRIFANRVKVSGYFVFSAMMTYSCY